MRQQRNQEARQLIGNSVDKAKAIFAQNTAAGQLQNKAAKTAPVKPVRNSITRSATNQRQQQSPEPEKSPQHDSIEEIEPSSPTGTPQPSSNNNNLEETTSTVADQSSHSNLEDDDSDPYSTIKRSPYTKVTTNSQHEPSANGKQADNVQTEAINTQQNDTEQKVDATAAAAADKQPIEQGKTESQCKRKELWGR